MELPEIEYLRNEDEEGNFLAMEVKTPYIASDDYGNEAVHFRKRLVYEADLMSAKTAQEAMITAANEQISSIQASIDLLTGIKNQE